MTARRVETKRSQDSDAGTGMAEEKNKGSGRGRRDLTVRVKTAKGRKLSSTLWLQRQLNDPYVQRARAEGYRGRAAYKILEQDDKYGFLKPGAREVDLGCAPGGWCQVAVARVNALLDGEDVGAQGFLHIRIVQRILVRSLGDGSEGHEAGKQEYCKTNGL